jgi:hypothetical protein
VNGVDGDYAAFAQAGKRRNHHLSAGGEGDGAIEFEGRAFDFRPDPLGAQ